MLHSILIALMIQLLTSTSTFKEWRNVMKKEKFENITIAYMRRTGAYGLENAKLMETFKHYLKSQNLFNHDSILLGIALDNPEIVPKSQLRYDVGIIIDKDSSVEGLESREIDDGMYAIFEVDHTEKGVQDFWENISNLVSELNVDYQKPILERYTLEKIERHFCEFCIPLTN